MQLPAIDQNICAEWTQLENNFYNKLEFYLMQGQSDFRKHWTVWSKLLGSIPWKANMGDTMRRVATEPSPVIRQQAFPELLAEIRTFDVVSVRERRVDAKVRRHGFVSPNFYFLPSFQDFLRHIDDNMENLNRQIQIYEDLYYRTHIWHRSPRVYVCGVGLVEAPTGDGNAAGTSGKTNAWIQNELVIPLMGVPKGYLSFQDLFLALNAFEQIAGGTPFEGTGMPKGDSAPLNQRFVLVQSGESWNNFVTDPWLTENRPLNMDIVTDSFKGDLWGRIRSKLESYPLRLAVDNDGVVSYPVPEVIEENPDREDFGQNKPNPAYTIAAQAQLEVAFLVGGKSYEKIDVGPPPPEFTKAIPEESARKMSWNGKPYMTKDLLVPCKDANGNTFYDTNSWGEYLRLQAQLALGISGMNPRNILPIIYKRRVGVETAAP